jgi:hypothetical protein
VRDAQTNVEVVRFVCFDDQNLAAYEDALRIDGERP